MKPGKNLGLSVINDFEDFGMPIEKHSMLPPSDDQPIKHSLTFMPGDSVSQSDVAACKFKLGDPVRKVGGDYVFDGHVVAIFTKLSGKLRLVIENGQGILHIFAENNLEARQP